MPFLVSARKDANIEAGRSARWTRQRLSKSPIAERPRKDSIHAAVRECRSSTVCPVRVRTTFRKERMGYACRTASARQRSFYGRGGWPVAGEREREYYVAVVR